MPSMRVSLVRLLFFPGLFFEERTPRSGVAGRVVAAVAVLQAVLVVALTALIALRLAVAVDRKGPGDVFDLIGGGVSGDAVLMGLLVVVNWLLVSVVLHVAVRVLGGEGNIGDTLYVVGWSAPVALLSPLLAGVVVVLTSPERRFWEGVGDELDVLAGNVFATGIFAAVLVLCWQGYVWRAGLEATHDMSRDAASKASFATVVRLGLVVLLSMGGV